MFKHFIFKFIDLHFVENSLIKYSFLFWNQKCIAFIENGIFENDCVAI